MAVQRLENCRRRVRHLFEQLHPARRPPLVSKIIQHSNPFQHDDPSCMTGSENRGTDRFTSVYPPVKYANAVGVCEGAGIDSFLSVKSKTRIVGLRHHDDGRPACLFAGPAAVRQPRATGAGLRPVRRVGRERGKLRSTSGRDRPLDSAACRTAGKPRRSAGCKWGRWMVA